MLVHEVGHFVDVRDVGSQVGVIFELSVGELTAKLVKRYFILLEVGMTQLAEDALDMATLDGLVLLGLSRGHVALQDAPCLLTFRIVGLEVLIGIDGVFVIDIDVCSTSVPEGLPSA